MTTQANSTEVRISPRTGRPVRAYDDSISTIIKALDWDTRAIRKLVTKWPEGARRGNGLEPWPQHLAAILLQVLCECEPVDLLLTYTAPHLRDSPNRVTEFQASAL